MVASHLAAACCLVVASSPVVSRGRQSARVLELVQGLAQAYFPAVGACLVVVPAAERAMRSVSQVSVASHGVDVQAHLVARAPIVFELPAKLVWAPLVDLLVEALSR